MIDLLLNDIPESEPCALCVAVKCPANSEARTLHGHFMYSEAFSIILNDGSTATILLQCYTNDWNTDSDNI